MGLELYMRLSTGMPFPRALTRIERELFIVSASRCFLRGTSVVHCGPTHEECHNDILLYLLLDGGKPSMEVQLASL